MRRVGYSVLALSLLLAGGPSAAQPQVQPVFAGVLPNVPGMRLTAIRVTYPPGEASPSHRHADAGFLIAYVLRGRVRSRVEGEPERVYGVGESWTEGPGARHPVSANASETEPAEILVVFIAPPQARLTTRDE